MFNLGADAGLQAFNLIEYRVQTIAQVQFPTLARSHRDMPANRVPLAALLDTLIAGVSVHIRFLSVQQRFGRIDVVNVGSCTDDGVDQPRLSVYADVG